MSQADYIEEAMPVIEPVNIRRRRIRNDTEMDITPMIDITFLLLFFFLVASRPDDAASLELPPARNGDGVSMQDAAVLTLVPAGKSAKVYLADGKYEETTLKSTDPAAQEVEIGDYLQEQLGGDKPKLHVLVKAESSVPHREVSRIARAVGKATEAPLYFAVLEE